MARHFSALLRRMRQERGFRSAYAFYKGKGGRRVFPFTYTYYAKIEKGSALPRPAWLPILLAALGFPSAADGRRDFTAAYLRDVFGDDGLFDDLVGPWLKPALPASVPEKAVRRLLGRVSRSLTREECSAVSSSPAAFWSFFCLTKNSRPMSLEELAETARLPQAQVAAGLKALLRSRLVKRLPDGSFSGPLWKDCGACPSHGREHEALRLRMQECIARAVDQGGGVLMRRRVFIRAEEEDMLGAAQALQETVESAQGCSVEHPGHRTALYAVEVELQRVFPF